MGSYASNVRTIGLNGRLHLPSYIRMILNLKKGDQVKVDYNTLTKTVFITKIESE